MPHVDSAQYCR